MFGLCSHQLLFISKAGTHPGPTAARQVAGTLSRQLTANNTHLFSLLRPSPKLPQHEHGPSVAGLESHGGHGRLAAPEPAKRALERRVARAHPVHPRVPGVSQGVGNVGQQEFGRRADGGRRGRGVGGRRGLVESAEGCGDAWSPLQREQLCLQLEGRRRSASGDWVLRLVGGSTLRSVVGCNK